MGQIWPIREGPLTQVDLEPTWGGRPNPSRHREGGGCPRAGRTPWGPHLGWPLPLPLGLYKEEPPPLIPTPFGHLPLLSLPLLLVELSSLEHSQG